jgi:hypothetical protein
VSRRDQPKHCEGCGTLLSGRQTRFCSARCRSRVRRATDSSAAASAVVKAAERPDGQPDSTGWPDDEPGRCRVGLETWLETQPNVPEALTEAARSLADRVDADPRNSPLWGRYAHVLSMVVDVALEREEQAAADILWSLFADCSAHPGDPRHRMSHCATCCAASIGGQVADPWKVER